MTRDSSESRTDDFRERPAKYGLEDETDALLRYLDTRGGVETTGVEE